MCEFTAKYSSCCYFATYAFEYPSPNRFSRTCYCVLHYGPQMDSLSSLDWLTTTHAQTHGKDTR